MITTLLNCVALTFAQLASQNLIVNPDFTAAASGRPSAYDLQGSVRYTAVGYADENAGMGVALDSYASGSPSAGSISQLVRIDPQAGRWITFRLRGRAEDGFNLADEQLYMKLDFYAADGARYQDSAKRLIWREVARDRKDFAINGDNHKNGASVWRSYQFEERLPFTETNAVKVTLGFSGGAGKDAKYSRFYATDFQVRQATEPPQGKSEPAATTRPAQPVAISDLVPLGGRWYYRPVTGEAVGKHLVVNVKNADRLYYKDDGYSTPFAGNMDAVMMPGFLDVNGQPVKTATYVPDNVWIEFDGSDYWTVHAKNIPNHPTAKFPDTIGTQGYNPNYIMAHTYTYRLPLNPARNPKAAALPSTGQDNRALHMGSIGFAINGVAFYNPYDAGSQDATGIMDRCCGHPSPDYRYHYHKYPICVNTPFVDKGDEHSPLIGFAFDGFPVYGPYESAGVMARDLAANKLDAFNAHYDPERGWHYHVTPGKFPYLIGGFMGAESAYVSR